MIWICLILFVLVTIAYCRMRASVSSVLMLVTLSFITYYTGWSFGILFAWSIYAASIVFLYASSLRHRYLSGQLLDFYRNVMPAMSRTEREAIDAGTVTWEGDLFKGNPDWHKLLNMPAPKLSQEEQAFLDGPVNTLCGMINDWEITHQQHDLPPEMWRFLKEQGFFGLIIPKQYGGKAFSAYAHSQIIVKVSGLSITVSTTLAVPNSLGPAELLLHYGTDEQKNYYLPRLARGEEIPCFALTSPDAGSDASSMRDQGIVCWGMYQDQKTLGIRLNFDKRYITLAPIATVIGLAFKLYDPDQLLGNKSDIGITCALIPRNTPGMVIGRRHIPLSSPFQNGPIQGTDVFIPMDWIIGGVTQAGNGWRMLMECLAAGRAITLPSSAVGGAKLACYTTGAYASIRKQFNTSIGKFEGVEELLARMTAYTYMIDAARLLTVETIDHGERPAVASAIVKYHATEYGRHIACDAMDIHGGKAICLGPNNYIAGGYQSIPVAITVEGANVLTRNMIIFGQGAIRCHPYVLMELEAARLPDRERALKQFDSAVMKHIGFALSNVVRSFILGLTGGRTARAPQGELKRYFQQATRFSAALALLADVSMLSMGGQLKRKESISARLGDVLSFLYILSAALKHYYDQGKQKEDLPIIRYASEYCLYQIQERINDILDNYPMRWLGYVLRALIFPLGMHTNKPNDKLKHKIAQLMMTPSRARERIANGIYLPTHHDHFLADIEAALNTSIAAEPIEKTLKEAKQTGKISGIHLQELAQAALSSQLITVDQFNLVLRAEAARKKIIAVDDFSSTELSKTHAADIPGYYDNQKTGMHI